MKKCLIPHERQKLEFCLFCHKKINLSYMEKLKEDTAKVPIETKQKLLDLLREGKTVGEARDAVGLDLQIVGEIIMQNIESCHWLSNTAK